MTSARPILRIWLVAAASLAVAAVVAPTEAAPPQCVIAPPPMAASGLRSLRPRSYGGGPALTIAPHVGSLHILVILAEFSDLPHHIAASRFPAHLFGTGNTVTTYYDELSGGRLAVDGDVYGWFTLPHDEHYYSNGEMGVGSYPNNGQKLAEDAVAAAIAGGVDLSAYDANADGVVDALLVIHSGEGFEWAGTTGPNALTPIPDVDSINSHKWVVVNGNYGADLPRVVDYFTGPELQRARTRFFPAWTDSIATVGVLCHELGHVLGLPDFYDTQTGASRLGAWEIMDAGVWNWIPTDPSVALPGALPGHFSAWSETYLGWTTPVVLAPPIGDVDERHVSVSSGSTGGAPLQLLQNPGGVDWAEGHAGTGEYFLAEVRTREGFDAGLPAAGLLVFHVDESRAGNVASSNVDGGGLLLLAPQDGSSSVNSQADDPWPGTQSTFGADSNPSSALFDGTSSGVTLSSIGALAGGSVSLTATIINFRAQVPIPFARPNPYRPSTDGEVALVLNLAGIAPPVTVTIHDLLGRRVRTLAGNSDFSSPGRIAHWDGRADDGTKLPAGVYFFRVRGGVSGTGRVLLLR
jgi:immune inhibitor A